MLLAGTVYMYIAWKIHHRLGSDNERPMLCVIKIP